MKRVLLIALVLAVLPARASAQKDEASRIKSGITHDQMHALQQALKDDGCYRGRVDGMIGPATRRAIACSRKKHDISGNNSNELFRVLNLDFTVDDSTGMGGVMRSGSKPGYRPPERQRDRGAIADTAPRSKGMPVDTHGVRKTPPAKPVKP
jgi:peptidoglycan hydrolase-like protein with peptidoglycan-binding domain